MDDHIRFLGVIHAAVSERDLVGETDVVGIVVARKAVRVGVNRAIHDRVRRHAVESEAADIALRIVDVIVDHDRLEEAVAARRHEAVRMTH